MASVAASTSTTMTAKCPASVDPTTDQQKPEKPLKKAPGPRPLPLVGNIFDLDLKAPYASALGIAKQYGDIFQMTYAGKREINVCTRELADEVCDEKRFHKLVASGVSTLREVVEDALFTAHHGSRQWGITHRILKPIFGPIKIREMFDDMKDVAEQLCLKWARDGPYASIDPAFDYTRLTLDTIAMCLMDYRFNSFYRGGTHHPFVKHMVDILAEADIQSMLPGWAGIFRPRAMLKFKRDIQLMHDLCRGMVEFRRQHPVETNDFLNAMLNTPDPETGEKLDDDEVVRNLMTFLVAGHETTSGLLCFATYYLLEHPETLQKLQAEVDEITGGESITLQHIQKMQYMDAVLREALRLMPTAVAFYVTPFKDEIIGGKYLVHPGEAICLLLDPIHRDKKVWGEDADEWKPERMMQDKFDKMPRNSWKPFGNGARICLGMAFSWQESKLALAMILQNFDLSKDDPSYELKIKHLLTIKPEGFKIKAKLRQGRNATAFHRSLRVGAEKKASGTSNATKGAATMDGAPKNGRPMTILYGSETGTCEALAQHLAGEASARGFAAKVELMNTATRKLPLGEPVVFVLGSYHGTPSRNAAEFVKWVEGEGAEALKGVDYAVYGVGHSDWTQTFYQIPAALDEQLKAVGAERIAVMGRVNTARDDIFAELDAWLSNHLWKALNVDDTRQPEIVQNDTELEVIVGDVSRSTVVRKGFTPAKVTDIQLLSQPGVARKVHLELCLADQVAYQAGDHVQVLPANDKVTIQRALSRFGLEEQTPITIRSSTSRATAGSLPVNTPLKAGEMFAHYIDLRRAANARNVDALISIATDDDTRQELRGVLAKIHTENTASVLDLLDKFPNNAVPLPLSSFLTMLPAILPRTYSFSSAPEWKPSHATLTVNVVDRAAAGENRGLASNYIASLEDGDEVLVSVPEKEAGRPALFSLPSCEGGAPVVMICAGTGLAPFRGFVQERALYLRNKPDAKLAPAMLFFGCRGQDLDDLYRAELDAFEKEGVVDVRRAYSQDQSRSQGCKYVTDRVQLDKSEIVDLWKNGGRIFVCGMKRMSDAVLDVLGPALLEVDQAEGKTDKLAVDAWRDAVADRYVVEIFS